MGGKLRDIVNQETFTTLTNLRNRLNRENLTLEEWNALIAVEYMLYQLIHEGKECDVRNTT